MKRKSTKIIYLCLLISLLVTLLSGCGSSSKPPGSVPDGEQARGQDEVTPQELIISAAGSLTDVMEELKGHYEKKSVHTLIMNYGSSGALQQQIEQGAPADVFISAAQRQMDGLQEQGLIITDSRVDLLENAIVLIIPVAGGEKRIVDFDSLSGDAAFLLAIGDPDSVPAGQYAREVLTSLGLWKAVQHKLVLGKNVQQVLTYVETGNVDAGMLFMTDPQKSRAAKIVATAPPGSHAPATYPAAIVAGTAKRQAAEDFMAFLQSDPAKEIFEQYGFTFLAGKQDQ